MKRFTMTFVFLVAIAMATVAVADCYYNGRRVPEGTRIGPMVCEGGQWVYRP